MMLCTHPRVGAGSWLGTLEPSVLYSIVGPASKHFGDNQWVASFSKAPPPHPHETRSSARPATFKELDWKPKY